MFDIIKNIILEYVDISEENITKDTMFFADLQMDSIEILSMICKIEEKFDIELPTAELKNIYTVGDLISYIEEKSAKNKN